MANNYRRFSRGHSAADSFRALASLFNLLGSVFPKVRFSYEPRELGFVPFALPVTAGFGAADLGKDRPAIPLRYEIGISRHEAPLSWPNKTLPGLRPGTVKPAALPSLLLRQEARLWRGRAPRPRALRGFCAGMPPRLFLPLLTIRTEPTSTERCFGTAGGKNDSEFGGSGPKAERCESKEI